MENVPPARRLAQLISGYWMSQAVYVAAKLELADQLASGPRSVGELATATHTHPPALYRLLRALAALGVFHELPGRWFENSALSAPLQKGHPQSQWAMAVMMGEEHFAAWGQLLHSIRTGEGGFRRVFGAGVFDFLQQHPEQAALFDAAMTSIHGAEARQTAEVYDFGQFATLCDVGGGNGHTLETLLTAHSRLRGVLLDLPQVVQRAESRFAGNPLRARLTFAAGDFFSAAPPGLDAYHLRHILHDWDDAHCLRILSACRAAALPTSKLLVVETLVPGPNEPGFVKWLDLTMLVIPEGQERTADEYRDLFAAGGWRLTSITPTAGEVAVLEALPLR